MVMAALINAERISELQNNLYSYPADSEKSWSMRSQVAEQTKPAVTSPKWYVKWSNIPIMCWNLLFQG